MTNNNASTIPKIIHQIWLGDLPAPTTWMQTVKNHHPDYDYRLWTDDNLPTPLYNQTLFQKVPFLLN